MTASANGWRVLTAGECAQVQVPGGVLPVHPELAWLAWDSAHLWDETVEALVWPGCWGWSPPRPIRGGTVMTNHASGTAWDLCATVHPRGVPIGRTFTAGQLEAVARMEARYFGVLRWGGRWNGAETDGMHWEVAPGVTVEAVRDLTASLKDTPTPPSPTAPPSSPPVPTGWTGPDLVGAALTLRGEEGNNGPRVARLQDFWRIRYRLYAKDLAVDGWWGPATTAVCREFARRSRVPAADGRNIGPLLARQLYLAGLRL